MTFKVNITQIGSPSDSELFGVDLESAKVRIQAAMANRFASLCHANFGPTGESRPSEWPELSPRYAKEYHGGNQVPTLQLSGELQSSIQIEESNRDFSEVYTVNEYAEAHQWGDPTMRLPARPFFPMTIDGQLTEYAKGEVLAAADGELERILTGHA